MLRKISSVLLVLFMVVSAIYADDVYTSAPNYSAPYYAGSLNQNLLNEALEELNYIRSLIGVPANVTLNDTYTNKAQHGAVLLDVIDTLTHTPSMPSDMSDEFYQLAYDATTHGNLAMGVTSLGQSLKLYMDDSDASNIDRIGHRRWLMNPRMKQVGFGLSTRKHYSATYVIEEAPEDYEKYQEWHKWPISDEFITWPTHKSEHPLTYFDSNTAWCVVLNEDVFEKSNTSSVHVTLTRLSDYTTWNFSTSNTDGDFYDNQQSYAYDECIIFRPDNATYKNGEEWRVDISGLTRKNGG